MNSTIEHITWSGLGNHWPPDQGLFENDFGN